MAELFADGKHGPTNRYEKGDSNLKREISRNIDLGVDYRLNNTLISFDLYRNNISNYIYLRDLGTKNYDGDHLDANWSQKDTIIQGYELSLEKSLSLGEYELLVTLGRDDISAVFENNKYVPRIPSARNMIDIVMLGKNNEKYSINFTHSEHQKDIESGIESKTNSYIDLGVKYSNKIQINKMYDLNMNLFVNNLLDQTIRNHASFVKAHVPLPGASFGFDVSVDYKF
jgi:iron complex outermembrane receptor protein